MSHDRYTIWTARAETVLSIDTFFTFKLTLKFPQILFSHRSIDKLETQINTPKSQSV